jgi:hypothetical protein
METRPEWEYPILTGQLSCVPTIEERETPKMAQQFDPIELNGVLHDLRASPVNWSKI